MGRRRYSASPTPTARTATSRRRTLSTARGLTRRRRTQRGCNARDPKKGISTTLAENSTLLHAQNLAGSSNKCGVEEKPRPALCSTVFLCVCFAVKYYYFSLCCHCADTADDKNLLQTN